MCGDERHPSSEHIALARNGYDNDEKRMSNHPQECKHRGSREQGSVACLTACHGCEDGVPYKGM